MLRPPVPLEPSYRAKLEAALVESQNLSKTIQSILDHRGSLAVAKMQIRHVAEYLSGCKS